MADSIIQQLVHRKMFRITAGYLAVAWVLWQVVDTTCPTFECSLSFQKSIFWFLVAGLPITLAIAWVHWQTAVGVGIGILAGATVMFFVMRGPAVEPETSTVTSPAAVTQPAPVVEEKSIAVLPFADMSAAGDQGYFGDGVAEEILNALVKLPELRVAARTSAFTLRGQSIDVVGEKLNVNHVLEGSIRKEGDRLRITAQLLKVDDGFHLWSETYDRELTSIFAVQDEIARAVVDALKVELGVETGTTLVDIGTSNREAYDWFLRGKDALVGGTAEGYKPGIEYFNRAIKVDPDYADAYAYLAYAHILQHPFTPYRELAPAIQQAYSKALALEPSHNAALCTQGYDKMFSDWDWAAAAKLFRKATRDGKMSDVCSGTYLGWYLLALGQYDRAITILRDAERVDPLNLGIKYQLGDYLGTYGGESEESIIRTRAVLDAAPNHVFALVSLTQTHLNAGQLEEAESPLTRLESSADPAAYQFAVWLRVELEVLRGDGGKAQSVYDEGRRVAESGVNKSPALWLNLGLAAVFLGHLDEAISLFNRSLDAGAPGVVWVRPFITSWPAYTQGHGPALMAHADFQAFLAKMNLDDASIAALEAAGAGE